MTVYVDDMRASNISIGIAGTQRPDGTKASGLVFVAMAGSPTLYLSPTVARRMARDMRQALARQPKEVRAGLLDVVAEIERCANEVEASLRPAAGRA